MDRQCLLMLQPAFLLKFQQSTTVFTVNLSSQYGAFAWRSVQKISKVGHFGLWPLSIFEWVTSCPGLLVMGLHRGHGIRSCIRRRKY